jgi:hypothetical protein
MKNQSAHEYQCAVAQKLPCFIYWELAEGTRFETLKPQGLEVPISPYHFVLNHLQKS